VSPQNCRETPPPAHARLQQAMATGQTTEDWLFQLFEDQWLKPCTAKTPHPAMNGLCVFAPVFMIAALVILLVALLAWCEKRQKKPAQLEGGAAKKAPKKTRKTD
jgi:hypothetical protein